MKIAYKNKWSSWNNKHLKIYLITPINKEKVIKKLKLVNRFLKKPAHIIDTLPNTDNKISIEEGDTIIEFDGLYKADKLKCFKTYYTNEELDNYRLSYLDTLLLSSMNFLDKDEDMFLIFTNTYWGESCEYEVGYISTFPKSNLKTNIEHHNDKIKRKVNGYLSLFSEDHVYIHSSICIIEDNNWNRPENTIKIMDNEYELDFLENLTSKETYIKTSLLVKYDYNLKEFIYDLNKIKEFINKEIEK